ncbi:IS630 family transposase [Chroococcidiopsidales cyanobacterium LEGE 13417]|nr:IS630 family transposase [Chroococcidiopsidales cyanobacterium LEGE 13417]
MKLKDARHMSASAQEALRYRVVNAIENGMSKSEASRVFQVSRTAIHHWTKATATEGAKALKAKKRGPRSSSRLLPHQAATAVRLIEQKCPDQLGLPFYLWTREAVQQFLAKRFELSVSVWTVGRYLKKWSFTPQKPLRRAYEQDPLAVQRWLETEYPQICRDAHREGAEIHWGDEMGVRSDYQAGRSYGRSGQTPIVSATGKRFRCNLISTITNRGKLCFKVFTQRFDTTVMLDFLRRLVRHSAQKVFLIVDGHPVHRSRAVHKWLEKHSDRIRMFFLPAYSPELNPDELLNHDIKANAVGRQRAKNKTEMIGNIRSYLRSTQRFPHVVQNFFHEKHVAYAAA